VDFGVALHVERLLGLEKVRKERRQNGRRHQDVGKFIEAVELELAAFRAAPQHGADQVHSARQDLPVVEFGEPGKTRAFRDDHVEEPLAIGADHVAIHYAGDQP
jgi:hypothetical protein